MSKEATILHLVEKGIYKINLHPVSGTEDQWETGKWWVSDKTANQLIGKRIYLHAGQGKASHIGGEIVAFHKAETDPKRKVFIFKELKECRGVTTTTIGWSREKKIIWSI